VGFIQGLESTLNAHNSHRFTISGITQPNESNLSMNNSFLGVSNKFDKP